MGTANFYHKNVLFAVKIINDFDYDNLVQNLTSDFLQLKDFIEGQKLDHDRSHPGRTIGEITGDFSVPVYYEGEKDKTFAIYPTCKIQIRSGYYTDANLDFEWLLLDDYNCDFDNLQDHFDYIGDCRTKDLELFECAISRRNFARLKTKIETFKEKTEKQIRNIFSRYGEQLICNARFSNGSAIYSPVSKPKTGINAVINHGIENCYIPSSVNL